MTGIQAPACSLASFSGSPSRVEQSTPVFLASYWKLYICRYEHFLGFMLWLL